MNREEMLEKVRAQMTEHRFTHTLGVASTAVILAERYGANAGQAELAGILHDYCKYWDKGKMKQIIEQEPSIPKDLLQFDQELWHAPVGAVIVQKELGISDPEVLAAIRYHTSGRPGMSVLEKILWLADYIEPGRHFPGVEDIRQLARIDLDEALSQALGNTICFLVRQRKRIYPLTLDTYNDVMLQLSQKGKEQGG